MQESNSLAWHLPALGDAHARQSSRPTWGNRRDASSGPSGNKDRPVLVILVASTALVVICFALVYLGFVKV
jgi:hypothetical protein